MCGKGGYTSVLNTRYIRGILSWVDIFVSGLLGTNIWIVLGITYM